MPSIFDYRETEISAARQIRRDRMKLAVGVVLGAPVAVALIAAWVVFCAIL